MPGDPTPRRPADGPGPTTVPTPPQRPRPRLIAVGTSWGGLRAVGLLLDALPGRLDAPIVVIQHRGTAPSELARLLGRHTAWPVCEADDKEGISGDRVYLAPPDYHLLIEPGRFALSTDAPVLFSRPSIDVCFESAADAYGEDLVGVLLTGANEDGARGLAHIQARGGRTIVQDPAEAERPDMPRAALARMTPDHVGGIEDIAATLVDWCGLGDRGPKPDGTRAGAGMHPGAAWREDDR